MSLEPVLEAQFNKPTSHCLSTRVRVAFVEGCSCGVAGALIYLAEAPLFLRRRCAHRQGHAHVPSDVPSPQPRRFHRFHWLPTHGLHAQNNRQIRSSYHKLNQLVNLGTMGSSESQDILHPRVSDDIVFNNVSLLPRQTSMCPFRRRC